MDAITDGSVVTMHYTLRDADGSHLRTSRGLAPVRYVHGRAQLPVGIEWALTGRVAGNGVIEVTVSPEDGYGVRRGPGAQEVPRRELPGGLDLEVGKAIALARPGELPLGVWVTRVERDRVWIDVDHPLAERTLQVETEVLEVREATLDERPGPIRTRAEQRRA